MKNLDQHGPKSTYPELIHKEIFAASLDGIIAQTPQKNLFSNNFRHNKTLRTQTRHGETGLYRHPERRGRL
jgi:hypothetical protein